MTKSELFKKAHAVAKATVKAVGNYQIAFSLALKDLYKEMKMSKKDQIINMGGKPWVKNGMDRVYFNCDVFNQLLTEAGESEVNLSDRNNKFFYDAATNAVMRSYKGKKPTVEIQYS